MHTDAAVDAHEVGHRGALIARAWGRVRRLADIDIVVDHRAIRRFPNPVEVGSVVGILLRDLEIAGRGIESLPAARYLRDADEGAAFEKLGALLAEVDQDRGRARRGAPVPIGDAVPRAAGTRARTGGLA